MSKKSLHEIVWQSVVFSNYFSANGLALMKKKKVKRRVVVPFTE
jgi:hypothetical protein